MEPGKYKLFIAVAMWRVCEWEGCWPAGSGQSGGGKDTVPRTPFPQLTPRWPAGGGATECTVDSGPQCRWVNREGGATVLYEAGSDKSLPAGEPGPVADMPK